MLELCRKRYDSAAMTSINHASQTALRRLMERVALTSWRSLSVVSGVSIGQIRAVRQGRLHHLTLGTIDRLAQALCCSRAEFLATLETAASPEQSTTAKDVPSRDVADDGITVADRDRAVFVSDASSVQADQEAVLQAECDRLRDELDRQAVELTQRFQSQAIDQLESFLTFWPVAADRARRDPNLPAIKLLPLLKPIEALLTSWHVEAIGTIGQSTEFDPNVHQAIGDPVNSGDRVRITHCGYRHGDHLLFRAKVSRDDNLDP